MMQSHLIPLDDIQPHRSVTTCWCHPLEREDGMVVHHAKDLREVAERQGRADPKKKWLITPWTDLCPK